MPTLTNALLSRDFQTTNALDDVQKGIGTGMQLATVQEDVANKRLQVDRQKQQIETSKFNRMFSIMDRAMKVNSPKARSRVLKAMQTQGRQMGLEISDGFINDLNDREDAQTAARKLLPLARQLSGNPEMQASVAQAMADEFGVDGMIELSSQIGQASARQDVRAEKKEQTRANILTKAQSTFRSQNKKSFESLNAATSARTLLSQNNPVADAAAATQLARLSGEVGALSEGDKAAFGGSRALLDSIFRSIEQLKTGKLTAEDRARMVQVVDAFERSGRANLTGAANAFSEGIAKANRNQDLTASDVMDIILPGQNVEIADIAAGPAAAPQESQDVSTVKNLLEAFPTANRQIVEQALQQTLKRDLSDIEKSALDQRFGDVQAAGERQE